MTHPIVTPQCDVKALLSNEQTGNPKGGKEQGIPSSWIHQAYRLLGGISKWSEEEQEEIQSFVDGLSDGDRQARVAGSEIDAALDDPRWLAQRQDRH